MPAQAKQPNVLTRQEWRWIFHVEYCKYSLPPSIGRCMGTRPPHFPKQYSLFE